jgi:hypothetical protein
LRPTGLDKSILTCGRQGYKFVHADGPASAGVSRRGALVMILLVTVSSAMLSYFLSEVIFGHRAREVVKKNITLRGVTVSLHIVNSPSLQAKWIQHTLEEGFDSSTTDVFATKRGEIVYLSILDKHGGKTRVIAMGSEL